MKLSPSPYAQTRRDLRLCDSELCAVVEMLRTGHFQKHRGKLLDVLATLVCKRAALVMRRKRQTQDP